MSLIEAWEKLWWSWKNNGLTQEMEIMMMLYLAASASMAAFIIIIFSGER